ncbi:MAG TPA: sialidase family protein [Myxococcales bacterium]
MRPAALLIVAGCACGSSHPPPSAGIAGLVSVSKAAPWPATCGEAPGRSTVTLNSEVEPSVAVDPLDGNHLIGAWQQDRWANGGAKGVVSATSFDGGHTWTTTVAAFSLCSGGPYQRATDPWVSIGPDGAAWQIAYSFDANTADQAMLVSRSLDRGRSWEQPRALIVDSDPDIVDDKETVTADPHDARFVYAVWDRLTGTSIQNNPQGTGPTWFSRTTDRGETWEPARTIYDPGADAQTIGNQIVVLPDGTLVNLMSVITQNSTSNAIATLQIIRSGDRGATWSQPVPIDTQDFVGAVDPKSGMAIRSGGIVPAIAVDAASGALYVAWEDARFSGLQRDGVFISKSIDGGLSWSARAQVNGAPSTQAFTPALSVAADGRVGVLYTDLREDNPNDKDHLMATEWLAVSPGGTGPWTESRVGAPWNLRGAPVVGGPAYFLGDYQALGHAGNAFLPFFAAVGGTGSSDIFFRTADAPASLAPLAAVAGSASPLPRGPRERWRLGRMFK